MPVLFIHNLRSKNASFYQLKEEKKRNDITVLKRIGTKLKLINKENGKAEKFSV